MNSKLLQLVSVVVMLSLTGCSKSKSWHPDNDYADKAESTVRAELGKPSREFVGHYGLPDVEFAKKFTGEIRTLVFKQRGGEFYVSFEKRSVGWISICSSWLPDGAAF